MITPESIRNFFLTCFCVFCHHPEKEISKKEIEMKPLKKKHKKNRIFKLKLSTIFEE
jgi:hypothetical protein